MVFYVRRIRNCRFIIISSIIIIIIIIIIINCDWNSIVVVTVRWVDVSDGCFVTAGQTQIVTAPLDMMIHVGMEAKFTCTGTTDPEEVENLKISWKKDNQTINYELAQRIFQNAIDNSVTISGSIYLDTGKYTCVASNGLDFSEASAQLIVQGQSLSLSYSYILRLLHLTIGGVHPSPPLRACSA